MMSEEMEISTDFDPDRGVEDIDIDLDFAAGQPDEDLDLGDADADADELQHFNSDTRDESMAEGDDASFRMADADYVTYNEAAAAANDYDIDLGGADDNLWQQNDATGDEITYEDEEPAGETATREASQVENVTFQDRLGADVLGEASTAIEGIDTVEGVASQDFGLAIETGLTEPNLEALLNDRDGQPGFANVHEDTVETAITDQDHADILAAGAPGPSAELNEVDIASTEHQQSDDETTYDNGVVAPVGQNLEATEQLATALHDYQEEQGHEQGHEQDLEQDHGNHDDHDEDEIGYEEYEDDQNVDQQKAHAQQSHEQGRVDLTEEDAGLHADEYQLGDDSDENIHKQYDLEAPVEQEGDPSELGLNVQDPIAQTEDASTSDEVALIANRQSMIINYCGTDYNLFAASEEDDQNQYFLAEKSAVHLRLHEFLSSLREVISEEVSPLDELVMHVDGLGLEFGETTTKNGFLEKYTFADILTLFDTLVKNDEGDPPDLYIYLMVRPNCYQRLAALVHHANTGRSLTDVAVYRQATTPAANGLVISPETSVDDEYYDQDESAFDELDDDGETAFEGQEAAGITGNEEHKAELNNCDEPDTLPAGPNSALDSRNSEETNHEAVENNSAYDEIDYDDLDDNPDDNLNLSPSKNAGSNDAANQATNDEQTNGAVSHNSSATATVNGDEKDVIDYSDDDQADVSAGADGAGQPQSSPKKQPAASVQLKVAIEDEITWESENEEIHPERPTFAPKGSLQVSMTSGEQKRVRSISELGEGTYEQGDNKRRRP